MGITLEKESPDRIDDKTWYAAFRSKMEYDELLEDEPGRARMRKSGDDR